MKAKRLGNEQVVGVLKEHEAEAKVDEIRRRHAIGSAAFHARRKNYGGMKASDAKRRRELAAENAKPKRIVADKMQDQVGNEGTDRRPW